MPGGERLLQVVVFWIAVFPGLGGSDAHRLDRAWRGTEHAFVGPDASPEQAAARALLRLRSDEWHGRGQALDNMGIGWKGHARFLIFDNSIHHRGEAAVNRDQLALG